MPSTRILFAGTLAALGFLLSGCDINKLPAYDEQVLAAHSEILNQYQRRADLIPELVEVVQAAAAHEKDTLVTLAATRSHLRDMNPRLSLDDPALRLRYQVEEQKIDESIKTILAISEASPSLQANQHYLALVSEIEGTENRIAFARREYIQSVQIYNTELRTYPGKLIGAIFYPNLKVRGE